MARKKATTKVSKRGSKAPPKNAGPGDSLADAVIDGPATLPLFADGGDFVLTMNGHDLQAIDLASLRFESDLGTFTISRRRRPLVHDQGKSLTIWGRYVRGKATGGTVVYENPSLTSGAITAVYRPPVKPGPAQPPPKGCPFPSVVLTVSLEKIRPARRISAQSAILGTYRPPVQTATTKKRGS